MFSKGGTLRGFIKRINESVSDINDQITVRVALELPLRRLFDYRLTTVLRPPLSARVRVPFGRRELIGWIWQLEPEDALPISQQRSVIALLDQQPLLPSRLYQLLQWGANYYHHPLGEVIATALPQKIRAGGALQPQSLMRWQASVDSAQPYLKLLQQAPLQQKILTAAVAAPEGLSREELKQLGSSWQRAVERLRQLKLLQCRKVGDLSGHEPTLQPRAPSYSLTAEQQQAVAAISAHWDQFRCWLLQGITGSGKTEVYLQLIEQRLQAGRQVLVLVPEIGLTPQLLQRFSSRLGCRVTSYHSALSEGQRYTAWRAIYHQQARLIVGTRSALFAPFQQLGLIIIDEEHDSSFKQQDHWRYSARDVAIKRAQLESIPIVLGSATPSMESWYHAEAGRYQRLRLSQRAGAGELPSIHLIDLRTVRVQQGLSEPLQQRMAEHLQRGQQVLLYLNRRGYAPVLFCYQCRWSAMCHQCDSRMTLYRHHSRLRCHHCGSERAVLSTCPECQQPLHAIGEGTERLHEVVSQQFAEVEIVRVDRDTLPTAAQLQQQMERLQHGQRQIIIGTQLITKGHHFPNLTLVGVIHGDQGLFSLDFRAAERMAQQLLQVAGRAGRECEAGEVYIQTHDPSHPLFRPLRRHDYEAFLQQELPLRQQAELPPYTHIALIRAEAKEASQASAFLETLLAQLVGAAYPDLDCFGPVAAPLSRRRGYSRWQLLLQSRRRETLHTPLLQQLPLWERLPQARRVRWSIDIDPLDLY
ncbi:primosomal protein N' [Ectothiorhodospiraceae bacterium BW-2]|nr:primosomal protein N' [Ectothiorhodospiraceae bacterium BW-2]